MLKYCLILLPFLTFAQSGSNENPVKPSYEVDNIELPAGLSAQVTALDFMPDGRLVAGFSSGEIMFYHPDTKKWDVFAHGMHEPLGFQVVNNTTVIYIQRPEVTRASDTDGDGKADLFETLTDDFGITGNFHEYNYGPVKDQEGNLFIGLNGGSPGGWIRSEVRGKLDLGGYIPLPKQMFSVVPYRGWIMKLTPEGKLLPFASGFRSPNGLGFDNKGNLYATDNQGDWIGTSPLHHVQEGNFYGHPSSLYWREGWEKGPPGLLPVHELDSMRTKAAILFPHGIIANSPTQPLTDLTEGKFGPFAGQMLVGEMNSPRIVRVLLEEVGGQMQGACLPFLDGHGLRKGNNRLAFDPDGNLWTGQNDHGWAGDKGIQRIRYTGVPPMDILNMNLTPKGFDLEFTEPVDPTIAGNPEEYKIRSYYYEYHSKYGSDQFDVQNIQVTDLQISADGKKVSVTLNQLIPDRVYEFRLENFKSARGTLLANKIICYTLNRLKN